MYIIILKFIIIFFIIYGLISFNVDTYYITKKLLYNYKRNKITNNVIGKFKIKFPTLTYNTKKYDIWINNIEEDNVRDVLKYQEEVYIDLIKNNTELPLIFTSIKK